MELAGALLVVEAGASHTPGDPSHPSCASPVSHGAPRRVIRHALHVTTEGKGHAVTDTAGTNGTSTDSSATPSAGNSSDATQAAGTVTATSVTDAIQTATPPATRSDDTRGGGFDFTKLIDSLDSLPDRVANAVREAAPAPVTQSAPAKSDGSANNGTTASDTSNGAGANNGGNSARKKTFAEKWFGLP